MDNIIEKERSVCYHRGEGNGKCSGVGVKPHTAVSSFQNAFSARAGQGLRDTGIPTHTMLRAALKPQVFLLKTSEFGIPTHTMLRAALKRRHPEHWLDHLHVPTHIMPRAALKPLRCLM